MAEPPSKKQRVYPSISKRASSANSVLPMPKPRACSGAAQPAKSENQLREINYNLDMLGLARTTKLTTTSKEKLEDETVEPVNTPGPLVETDFYGGEQADEPENDDLAAEMWCPMFSFSHARLTDILARHSEVSAAS